MSSELTSCQFRPVACGNHCFLAGWQVLQRLTVRRGPLAKARVRCCYRRLIRRALTGPVRQRAVLAARR